MAKTKIELTENETAMLEQALKVSKKDKEAFNSAVKMALLNGADIIGLESSAKAVLSLYVATAVKLNKLDEASADLKETLKEKTLKLFDD